MLLAAHGETLPEFTASVILGSLLIVIFGIAAIAGFKVGKKASSFQLQEPAGWLLLVVSIGMIGFSIGSLFYVGDRALPVWALTTIMFCGGPLAALSVRLITAAADSKRNGRGY